MKNKSTINEHYVSLTNSSIFIFNKVSKDYPPLSLLLFKKSNTKTFSKLIKICARSSYLRTCAKFLLRINFLFKKETKKCYVLTPQAFCDLSFLF